MPNTIGGAVSIFDVFSRRWCMEIPDYQRDYAWDADDSLQLIDDFREELALNKQNGAEPSYYLGTIVLALPDAERTARNGLATAEIVDGQQRLATLTIFMACLRDLLPKGPRKDALDSLIVSPHLPASAQARFVLSLRSHDGDYLRKFVQKAEATLAPARQELRARRNIGLVRESVRKNLAQLSEAEREALADFIMKACRVAVVTTRSREQAWRIFGRVNQRGKRLRTTDILKAIILGALPVASRSHYGAIWEACKQELGSDFDGEQIGRRYLFNYIAEVGGRAGNILDSVIAQVQRLGAAHFMDTVFIPVARAFLAVTKRDFPHGTETQRSRINLLLTQLGWQSDDDWMSVAILLIYRLSEDPDRLAAQLAVLDRYLYGQMLLKRNFHRLRFKKADRLQRAKKTLVEAKGPIDLAPILRWAPVELKMICIALDYGLASGPAKAILARLALAAGEATVQLCDEIVRSRKWEVEHFVPVSPRANHDWQAVLGAGKSVGQYAKKLGNLFIAPAWLNGLLGNANWTEKIALISKHPDVPLLPMAASIRAPGWNGTSLDARHDALVANAMQLWDFDPPKAPKTAAKPKPKKKAPSSKKAKGSNRQ